MQGKSTHENAGKVYLISTGKLLVRTTDANGHSRLFCVVNGERVVSFPPDCVSYDLCPDRKVEYEMVKLVSPSLREKPDPTPIEAGIPLNRPLTLAEEMKRFIREEISQAAETAQAGSWEDEDDFEVDEDPLPLSQYEMDDMQEDADIASYDPDTEPAASAAPELPAEEPAAGVPPDNAEPEPASDANPSS